MIILGNVTTDEELQDYITRNIDSLSGICIGDRVFVEMPRADYNVLKGYKDHTPHLTDTATILIGEPDGYGYESDGSRDLKNNPIVTEEIQEYYDSYGVQCFHKDYQRAVAEEI